MAGYYRNPLCSAYSECLDFAAKKNLLLDCSQCPRQAEISLETDFCGEWALLLKAYRPALYNRLCDKNRPHSTGDVIDKIHDVSQRTRFIPVWKQ